MRNDPIRHKSVDDRGHSIGLRIDRPLDQQSKGSRLRVVKNDRLVAEVSLPRHVIEELAKAYGMIGD